MSIHYPMPRQIVVKVVWLKAPGIAAHSFPPPRRQIQGKVLRPQQPPPRPRRIILGTLRESTLWKHHLVRYPLPSQHLRPQRIIPGTAISSQHITDCTAQGFYMCPSY